MQSKRRLPKFSLLTAIACVFLAGILLALNVVPRPVGRDSYGYYLDNNFVMDLIAFTDRQGGWYQRGWPFYFDRYESGMEHIGKGDHHVNEFRTGFLMLDVMICCGIVFAFGVVFEWLVRAVRKQLR